MKALLYLRIDGSVMAGPDLERLLLLRQHALDAGYTVAQVWPVYNPEDVPSIHASYWFQARKAVKDHRFNVLVSWDGINDRPVTFDRTELIRLM
ncbi:hypothetical protein ABZZ74_52705 [Streptomyces sp. NPDC006476]|uniref:hypothetical protein n=1 Tax=Streptomyces sp. NPDC006476 TaxID=3157175 RepID=UPI0033BB5E5C